MKYDVIVVGGGHAGIEAALVSARMGQKTVLISMLAEQIGATSCNPAIGGLAKGHLVKEIDALGGQMGITTDEAGIQFRILNDSKGPAVRGSRAQIDMDKYRIIMRNLCINQKNLDILQETVESLILENNIVLGVNTDLLKQIYGKKTIITAGTFLDGTIHIGKVQKKAGRFGEFSSIGLSKNLRILGLNMGRLKTGTTPRIDGTSIDFSVMQEQAGDKNPIPFSFRTNKENFKNKIQIPCYIAYTNTATHTTIQNNFHRAPLFTGQIDGVGPRYCPSIEDKIDRFKDKDRHHLFIEPQTLEATEFYINGMSTSLPTDVQDAMIRSVKGMENAKIIRYGYAIEYDYINPTELKHTLETKKLKNLYCAGQINGTTGYEEAGAQGLMAGINAALSLQNKEPLILRRDEAYIGVLIDDLVTKGTKEPYRMFTSRAEYRLLLREDNADIRLSHYGYALGLLDYDFVQRIDDKKAKLAQALLWLKEEFLTPSKENNIFLATLNEAPLSDKTNKLIIASRKSFTIEKLEALLPAIKKFSDDTKEQILVESKYWRYIEKQQASIDKMKKYLQVKIPKNFPFHTVSGLSNEIVEKLQTFNPPTLQSASQISGITPAALDILHIYIEMERRKNTKKGKK